MDIDDDDDDDDENENAIEDQPHQVQPSEDSGKVADGGLPQDQQAWTEAHPANELKTGAEGAAEKTQEGMTQGAQQPVP